MNSFLFIIPCTPSHLQNGIRKTLWRLCLESLVNQTHKDWQALIVGIDIELEVNDSRFIQISYEGPKEEKLQKASEYIINQNIPGEYIIRLDDDDIINPTILKKVSTLSFDLYVDKYQWFWHYESGKISNKVWSWFPNTCIHKREHALTPWGKYALGTFKHFKEQSLLIENDHSKLHSYYKNKKVLFADKNHPVYVRTITNTSITAKSAIAHDNYLKSFGIWRKNRLRDFGFINYQSLKENKKIPRFTIRERIVNLLLDYRNKCDYNKNLKSNSKS